MPGPISQNGKFYSNDSSSPKISWFQISFKLIKPFGHKKRLRILQLPIPYCVSLIMVTITSHIFINIFQTVHFSAVKFTTGNEKNMSFLLIPKSPKVWKKSETIGPGTFKFWRYVSYFVHGTELSFFKIYKLHTTIDSDEEVNPQTVYYRPTVGHCTCTLEYDDQEDLLFYLDGHIFIFYLWNLYWGI